MITRTEATIEDLYLVRDNGKAEIVDGELVLMSPSGGKHGRALGKVHISLSNHEEMFGGGFAFADNVGFIVNLPRRKSFSPDAAWFDGGPEEIDMDFVDGSPVFAVEVRGKEDYTPRGLEAITRKIKDYFQAGTKVVWDVDLINEVVYVYRFSDADVPTMYKRGEIAEAEPAVPGWRMLVDRLFS